MAYADLAAALDVTVPAVKSLLVRARIGLAQAAEARDTACAAIRADLADAHERGVRASGLVQAPPARLRRAAAPTSGSCARSTRASPRSSRRSARPRWSPSCWHRRRQRAAAGGGASAAGGATAAAAAGAARGGVGAAGVSVSHIAAAVAVAVVSAGGAVEVQQQLAPHHRHHAAIHRSVAAPARRGRVRPRRRRARRAAADAARRRDAARACGCGRSPGERRAARAWSRADLTLERGARQRRRGRAAPSRWPTRSTR